VEAGVPQATEAPHLHQRGDKDEHGNPLKVILVDADTGESIWDLPNLQQIKLVLLLGNLPRDYWANFRGA
jgi:hypothetical protein